MHEGIVAMLVLHLSLVESFLFLGSDILVEFLYTTDFHFQVLALGIALAHVPKDVALALRIHIELEYSRITVNSNVLHITAIDTFLEIRIGKGLRGIRRAIAREDEENKSRYDNEIKPAEIEARSIRLILRFVSIIIVCCHLLSE